jgi:tetratricopeptide (TPR) repeat protein
MRLWWGAWGFFAAALLWAQPRWEAQEQLRMAQTLESIGDYGGAARIYERLLQMDPDSAVYLLKMSRMLVKLQRPAEALPRVKEYLQRHAVPAVWAHLGELYWRVQQADSARWAWEEALRRAPQDPESYRAVAQAQYELQLVEEAIATLQRARQRLRSDTLFADELSAWYVRLGDVERGVRATLQYLQLRQDLAQAQSRLLLYLALPEAAERIRQLMERYLSQYPRDPLLRRLFVWFLQEIGDEAAALEQVRRLDELQGGTGIELLHFAEAAQREEKFPLAFEVYQELLQRRLARELRLRAFLGYVQTAEMLVRQGMRDIPRQRVRRDYEALILQADTLPIGAEALYSLGIFLREVARDRVAAQEVFQRLLQRFPHTRWAAYAAVEMAREAMYAGDFARAERFLQQALGYDSLVPEAAEWARFWRAELFFFRGEFDSARAGYSAVAVRTGSPAANDALQRLVLFEASPAPELLRRFAEGELNFLQERYRQARNAYEYVAMHADTDAPIAELSLLRAAEAAVADGDFAAAERFLTRLFAEHDDALYGDKALLLLGEVLERQGRSAEALSVYQRFLLRYPDSIYLPQVQRRIERLRQGAVRGVSPPALGNAGHRMGQFRQCC